MESGEGSAPAGGQEPAPGWYPDPVDAEGLRYWDGKQWTVERTSEKTPEAPRPLRSVSRLAIGVLVFCALVNVAYVVVTIQYSDDINAALNANPPTLNEAQDTNDAFAGVSGFYGLSVLLGAIAFLIWFFRAYRNAEGLTGRPLRFGRGWSIGSWFVPFLNLWRPKQIANDVWRAGDPKARENAGWNSLPVAGIVHWWWVLWLLSGVVSTIGGVMLSPDPVLVDFVAGSADVTRSDLEMERSAATVLAASGALEVIAAVAAAMFVRQASRRQDDLISRGSG